jgi:hypothetical protein
MELVAHVVILMLGILVVVLALLFVVVDMFGRVDYLKTNFPSLNKMLERKGAIGALLLVACFLLIAFAYELLTKEVPEIPAPPQVTFKPPVPPAITIHQLPHAQKNQCWVRNYSVPNSQSSGQAVMLCNATYEAPFMMIIEYDQRLESAGPIAFPIGEMSHYSEKVQDNKIISYVDVPSIRPNVPFTLVVQGAVTSPLVKKVSLKTKNGVVPDFTY